MSEREEALMPELQDARRRSSALVGVDFNLISSSVSGLPNPRDGNPNPVKDEEDRRCVLDDGGVADE